MNTFDELQKVLKRLDTILSHAILIAEEIYTADRPYAAYRGMYVSAHEVAEVLQYDPLSSRLYHPNGNADLPLAHFQTLFDLTPFDIDVLILALSVELDLRYERIFAFLQDDVKRKLPTVDLALHLLAPGVERFARRAHFSSDAPLIRYGILTLLPDDTRPDTLLLSQRLQVSPRMVRAILGIEGIDERLAEFCDLESPETIISVEAIARQLAELEHDKLRCYMHGRNLEDSYLVTKTYAAQQSTPILKVDSARLLSMVGQQPKTEQIIHLRQLLCALLVEQKLRGAIIFWQQIDQFLYDDDALPQNMGEIVGLLQQIDAPIIMTGETPRHPFPHDKLDVVAVSVPLPHYADRYAMWSYELGQAGVHLSDADLSTLADRITLSRQRIQAAVKTAVHHACWHKVHMPTLWDCLRAAQLQNTNNLGTFAQRIKPLYTWDDIVLAPDTMQQLREIHQRMEYRHCVMDDWGFDRKLSYGKGINALFAGKSGTGKTMAAEVIAESLGLELYKVDLSGVVSKYIGETEKNLEQIFCAAEYSGALLFFDEADALFGKRSEVTNSHDRYANIEIGYLLQKMESYLGITILATNQRNNMDKAFVRRLSYIVQFDMPEPPERYRIWTQIFPENTPLSGDIDLAFMAETFKLSGGHIKNIALAAAFFAAHEQASINMKHLIHATQREYQKMGQAVSDAEFDSYLKEKIVDT